MGSTARIACPGAVRQAVATRLPTRWGEFQALRFERRVSKGSERVETAVALTMGDLAGDAPLLRIHSQCLTGEALGSLRCDCAGQLEMALRMIAEAGRGLIVYEHQEGRGIGLMAKLQAYALQDDGLDTVDANQALGFSADCRDFGLPVAILHHLGIDRVRLLSNNPRKSLALVEAGIHVVCRIPCEVPPTTHSRSYLETKIQKMGHALTLARAGACGRPEILLQAQGNLAGIDCLSTIRKES